MICKNCQTKVKNNANRKKVHGVTIHKRCPKTPVNQGYVLVHGRKVQMHVTSSNKFETHVRV